MVDNSNSNSKLLSQLLKDIRTRNTLPGSNVNRQVISGQQRARLNTLTQSLTTNRSRNNRP